MIMAEIYSSLKTVELEKIIELYYMNFDVKELHFSTCRIDDYIDYFVLIIYKERQEKPFKKFKNYFMLKIVKKH